MTACRNRARNAIRDAARARQNSRSLQPLLTAQQPGCAAAPEITDDRLRLIAMCCHPLLAIDAQVALTLRLAAGLTTQEIARGFHLPAATIAQRIVRAKRTLTAHRVTFAADEPGVRERLPSILDVVYLVFNEGYLSSAGSLLTRGDLATEAHRLAGLLTELAAGEPEPWALRALSFQLSRWNTRTGPDGGLLTLEVQDRGRWDRARSIAPSPWRWPTGRPLRCRRSASWSMIRPCAARTGYGRCEPTCTGGSATPRPRWPTMIAPSPW